MPLALGCSDYLEFLVFEVQALFLLHLREGMWVRLLKPRPLASRVSLGYLPIPKT